MFIVGNGEAGKTTLVHRLRYNQFLDSNERTDGIVISDIEIGQVSCTVMDFAGQEQYLYTHRLFFEDEAMFLVLHNPESGAEKALEMYLDMVRNCAPSAPVLLVLSRADDCRADVEYIEQLRSSYPQIADTVAIDSRSGYGIEELKSLVDRVVAERLPASIKEVPKSYELIRALIVKLSDENCFSLSLQEFCRLVQSEANISDPKLIDLALHLFCRWGFVYRLLGNEIVLRPQVLADVLACVFTTKPETLARMGDDAREGVLRHDNSVFETIWGSFSPHLWKLSSALHSPKPSFLDLLYRAGLAYELFDPSGKPLGASLVPALLPERPVGFRSLSSVVTVESLTGRFLPEGVVMHTALSLSCSLMPPSFIASLQVELRSLATLGGVWKRGGVYKITSSSEISYCILFLKNECSLELISAGDNTAARSVAVDAISKLLAGDFRSLQFTMEVSFEDSSWKDKAVREAIRSPGYIEHYSQGKVSRIWLRCFAKLNRLPRSEARLAADGSVDSLSAALLHLQDCLESLEAMKLDPNCIEVDTVEVDFALEDAVSDILKIMGVDDAGNISSFKYRRGKPQVCILFLPLVHRDTGNVSLFAMSPGASRACPWVVKTDCQVAVPADHANRSWRLSSERLSMLKALIDRTFRVLGVDLGDSLSLADLFDISGLTDEMLRIQDRSFVLTSHDRLMHTDDATAAQGKYSMPYKNCKEH
jgi:GTPase SAR1 family protein